MIAVSRRFLALILIAITLSIGWQVGRTISQLPSITADQITDDSVIFFGVDNTAAGRSYKISLEELQNTQAAVRNVKQFGAEGNWDVDASTGNDDTQAIQDAVDATPEGGVLYFPEGHFRCTGVNITRPIRIEGPGVLVVGVNEKGFDIDLSSHWSNSIEVTAETDYQLTGSATPTATKLTTISAHGCKQGDVLKILTEYAYAIDFTSTDYQAEIVKVIKVIDDDEFVIDRNGGVLWDFSATDAWVRKLPTGRVDIDINFDAVPGGEETERTVDNEALVCIQGAVDPSVKVNAINAYGPIVRLQSCFKGEVEAYTGDSDGPATTMSTPISGEEDGNGENSPAVKLVACNGTHVKAVTSGGKAAVWLDRPETIVTFDTSVTTFSHAGKNENITIHDSTAYAPYEVGFYIGAGSDRTTINNCQVFYATLLDTSHSTYWPVGYYSAGPQTRFDSCRVTGARYGWLFEGDVVTSGYIKTLNGCEDYGTTEAVVWDSTSAYEGNTVDIRNHRSTSNCTFLKHGGQGVVHVSDTMILRTAQLTIPTFSLELQGASLFLNNVTEHRNANAENAVVINVESDCLFCFAGINGYQLITGSASRSDSFLNVETNSEIRISTEGITFQNLEFGNGSGSSDWFSEHFVDNSSTGTVTFYSDSVSQYGRRIFYDGTVPAAGNWEQGDIVFNTDPDANEDIGWVCTAGGSPGTWKAFGPIDP